MDFSAVQVWGDSILKGVIFNVERGRYSILKQNALSIIGEKLGIELVNKSRMGRTAPEALETMKGESGDMTNTAVVIELGGNDCDFDWAEVAARPEDEHVCKTPSQKFTSSLEGIINLVRSRSGIPIICTLPPLDAKRYFNWITRDGLSRENILKYICVPERIYRWQEYYSLLAMRVAARMKCDCLPIREAILERLRGEDIWCVDGIHLNQTGHDMMADAVIRAAQGV
ncbi:MAG: SGNH/GDSL hydrolase family protein [Clostridia bacterium]|nr:SGNH/GDSL hydrolase family protein [Clostridia bacterium]